MDLRRGTTVALVAAALFVGIPSAAADHGYGQPQATWPITVQADGRVRALRRAVAGWNRTAGRPIFRLAREGATVTFAIDGQAWTEFLPSHDRYVPGLEPCIVHLPPRAGTRTVQHELGHCLGFADHVRAWYQPKLVTAGRVCDYSARPQYRGIMSYCTYRLTGNDRAMLRGAGY